MSRREYRPTQCGVDVVEVSDGGLATTLDQWDCLVGLKRCTTVKLCDREEYARQLAIEWADALLGPEVYA